jgi:cytochrome P450
MLPVFPMPTHRSMVRITVAASESSHAPEVDLMTALVQAEVDGEHLTDAEIATFFVLLAVAGNDTTRHTTSHAMRALSVNPDQRALLMEDLLLRVVPDIEAQQPELLRSAFIHGVKRMDCSFTPRV